MAILSPFDRTPRLLHEKTIVHRRIRWQADASVNAELAGIRRHSPPRFEMELLTAIVYDDTDTPEAMGMNRDMLQNRR